MGWGRRETRVGVGGEKCWEKSWVLRLVPVVPGLCQGQDSVPAHQWKPGIHTWQASILPLSYTQAKGWELFTWNTREGGRAGVNPARILLRQVFQCERQGGPSRTDRAWSGWSWLGYLHEAENSVTLKGTLRIWPHLRMWIFSHNCQRAAMPHWKWTYEGTGVFQPPILPAHEEL